MNCKYEVVTVDGGFWGRYPSIDGALKIVKYLLKKGIDAKIKVKKNKGV